MVVFAVFRGFGGLGRRRGILEVVEESERQDLGVCPYVACCCFSSLTCSVILGTINSTAAVAGTMTEVLTRQRAVQH